MKSLRLFVVLMLAPLAAPAAEPAEPLPPLFYVIVLSSQVTNLDSLALTPGPAGDANRKSTLLRPIACMGGDWISKLLAEEPTQAGRLAYMYISFDERHLPGRLSAFAARRGNHQAVQRCAHECRHTGQLQIRVGNARVVRLHG